MSRKLKTNKTAVVKNKHDTDDSCVANVKTASGLPQELEDQFELELCWCINQLCTFDPKTHLTGGQTEKKTRDLEKSLSILRGHTAPLIKKRQIMRQIFGNYREKMLQDEQKLRKAVSSVKFTPHSNLNKKSVFIKKANHIQHPTAESTKSQTEVPLSTDKRENELDSKGEISQVPFRFNFGKEDQS